MVISGRVLETDVDRISSVVCESVVCDGIFVDALIDSVVSGFSISVVISKSCVDVITVSVNDAEGDEDDAEDDESSYSVVNIKSIDEVVSSDV